MVTEERVIDGSYRGKIGELVLESAEIGVWLDLPVRVWFPRLLRRTVGRIAHREEFLNGNRETVRQTFFSRSSLLLYALKTHRRRRRLYPTSLARYDVVRLRSQTEVDRFLRGL